VVRFPIGTPVSEIQTAFFLSKGHFVELFVAGFESCGTLGMVFGYILSEIGSCEVERFFCYNARRSKCMSKSTQGGIGFWLDPKYWYFLAKIISARRLA
jgi:hypothetical protein